MRLLVFLMATVCVSSINAQPPGGGTGTSNEIFCYVEDIYSCQEVWDADAAAISNLYAPPGGEPTILTGTCKTSGQCSTLAPDPNDIDLATHDVSCSAGGNTEIEVMDDDLRFVIGFLTITGDPPTGSDPRSGRSGSTNLETSVICFKMYPCNHLCALKGHATQPFSLSDFECAINSNFPPINLGLTERVMSGDLCIGDGEGDEQNITY